MVVAGGFLVPTLDERAWIRRLYDAEVRHVDDSVGQLLALLERLGIYEDTLIVLTSDHGEEFWEHGRFHHGHSLHRELLHVPLIIKPPNGASRTTVVQPVSLTRVMPTILDVARLDHDPSALAGEPLSPLWQSAAIEAPRPLIGEAPSYSDRQIAVELDGHKLIRDLNTADEAFYDLSADPFEKRPLPAVSDRIRDALEAAIAKHENRSRDLREHYGIAAEGEQAPLGKEAVETLRALGYVN